jgi:hypothetical protein
MKYYFAVIEADILLFLGITRECIMKIPASET